MDTLNVLTRLNGLETSLKKAQTATADTATYFITRLDNLQAKFDSIQTSRTIDSMNYKLSNQADIVYNVNAFYDSAMTILLWIIGIGAVILPIVLGLYQWFTVKDVKRHVDSMNRETMESINKLLEQNIVSLNTSIERNRTDLDNSLERSNIYIDRSSKEINENIKSSIAEIKEELRKSIHNVEAVHRKKFINTNKLVQAEKKKIDAMLELLENTNEASMFYLQGLLDSNNKKYGRAIKSFLNSAKYWIKATDKGRCVVQFSNIAKCIENLSTKTLYDSALKEYSINIDDELLKYTESEFQIEIGNIRDAIIKLKNT